MTTYDYGDFIMTLKTGDFTPYMSKASAEIRNGDLFPEWKLNTEKDNYPGHKKSNVFRTYGSRMAGL